ncbi:hypothetical protein NQD34_016740 [Periophthalmus magnuspinnatus]|nr:hypothetical protein NQD34_016740 [Periophthalmus magnuspinnatus]
MCIYTQLVGPSQLPRSRLSSDPASTLLPSPGTVLFHLCTPRPRTLVCTLRPALVLPASSSPLRSMFRSWILAHASPPAHRRIYPRTVVFVISIINTVNIP